MDLLNPETNAILGFHCPCCDSEPTATTQTEYDVDHFGSVLLKQMRLAREFKPRFTLILMDPFGNCGLVSSDPSKIEKRKLSKRELQKIKFGQYASDSSGLVLGQN